jgi:hypothetical protein
MRHPSLRALVHLVLPLCMSLILGACGVEDAAVSPASKLAPRDALPAGVIGGSVNGLSGARGGTRLPPSVTIVLNGADPITLGADGSFRFPNPLPTGSAYAVSITRPPGGFLCTVAHGSGIVPATGALPLITIACDPLPAPNVQVRGTVSGLSGTLALQLNASQTLSLSTNGAFAFPDPVNAGLLAVAVSAQPTGQRCTVPAGVRTVDATTTLSNVDVVCDALPPNTTTVTGSVSGLVGTGLAVSLNGGSPLAVLANGSFTFPETVPVTVPATPEVLAVVQQPIGQVCTVANLTLTCIDTPVPSYSIGGSVTGLVGSVGLQLNAGAGGADAHLSLNSDGAFGFARVLPQGSLYAVAVSSQPAGQLCRVNQGVGTLAGTVTSVGVDCVTLVPQTTTVGGTVTGLIGHGLALSLNGGAATAVAADGSFTLADRPNLGAAYTVTVGQQPSDPAQTCTVTSGTGTANGAVSNVTVSCNAVAPPATTLRFAPVAASTSSYARYVHFTWEGVRGAVSYQLQKNADYFVGWVNEGSALVGTATSATVEVRSDWRTTRYRLQACNVSGCSTSSELTIFEAMLGTLAYAKASNTDFGDLFGTAVALSADGSTLAVGAPVESGNATGLNGNQADNSAPASGAVYVYVRSGGTWSQQAYVKASNTDSGDHFGFSVALSADGSTLAVGALHESSVAPGLNGNQTDNSAPSSGAVYVYVRSGGTWSQQAYVKASNTGSFDNFGRSVALAADGSTLAVGATGESSSSTGINASQANNLASSSGAVYVYTRSGGSWSQQAYVKASNTDSDDAFGVSVALSADGSTLAVGATGESSNATGLDGNQGDNSEPTSGAVYVYVRSGGTWSQQAYVKATNTDLGDLFGFSVALSADSSTLAVGAYDESGGGAAYVYTRSGGSWSQQAYIKSSNAENDDRFGYSIALSDDGSTLAVGATQESSNATGINGNQADNSATERGAVYVFNRSGSTWSQVAYVKASNAGAAFNFGSAVALSADGGTLAAAAPGESGSATGVNGNQADVSAGASGAVYVY